MLLIFLLVLPGIAMADTVWGIVKWTPRSDARLSGMTQFYFRRYDGDSGKFVGPITKFVASNRKTKFATCPSGSADKYVRGSRNQFTRYLRPKVNATLCWIDWRWKGTGKHRARYIASIRASNFAD